MVSVKSDIADSIHFLNLKFHNFKQYHFLKIAIIYCNRAIMMTRSREIHDYLIWKE